MQSVDSFGGPPTLLATATYAWSNLSIADDGSPLLPLTNGQCNAFTSFMNQSTFQALLVAELEKVLPVGSNSIKFTAPVTCGPVYATQTRDDHAAYFSVNTMSIKALYTLFAANAPYVTLGSAAQPANMLPESQAPLGLAKVRSVLQNALRRVTLAGIKAYNGLVS